MDGAAEPHTGEKGVRPREPSNKVPPFRAQGPGKSALGPTGKHFFTNVSKTGNQKIRKQDRKHKHVSCLANVFFLYPVLLTFVIKCFLFCLPAYVCIVFCFLLRLRFFLFPVLLTSAWPHTVLAPGCVAVASIWDQVLARCAACAGLQLCVSINLSMSARSIRFLPTRVA